jgi:hypothetical protein
MWASKQGGEARFRAVAVSHADKSTRATSGRRSAYQSSITIRSMADLRYYAGQARRPTARGRAPVVGLYGFSMMFSETKKTEYWREPASPPTSTAATATCRRQIPYGIEAADIPTRRAPSRGARAGQRPARAQHYEGVRTLPRYRTPRAHISPRARGLRAAVGENATSSHDGVGHLPGTA